MKSRVLFLLLSLLTTNALFSAEASESDDNTVRMTIASEKILILKKHKDKDKTIYSVVSFTDKPDQGPSRDEIELPHLLYLGSPGQEQYYVLANNKKIYEPKNDNTFTRERALS